MRHIGYFIHSIGTVLGAGDIVHNEQNIKTSDFMEFIF